jgi:hypothetical protein
MLSKKWWDNMEEALCHIEITEEGPEYLAKVQTELGGLREYRHEDLEEVLRQIVIDLQEEFEAAIPK